MDGVAHAQAESFFKDVVESEMKDIARSVNGERGLSLLAIQRIGCLRPAEKQGVLDLLDDGASLMKLSRRDIEMAVGRPLWSWRRQGAEIPFDGAALLAAAEDDSRLLQSLGARFVTAEDSSYPPALRELPDPPFGLYLLGEDLPADRPSIAVVGTRYPTGAAISAALGFAHDFSEAGTAVVSGLARGIDSAAHRGSLRGHGSTCAVLPCGVESVYPMSNRALAAAILDSGGLLVSEFPPGSPIRKSSFPERNRIISGLARGLLVVEAPARSGALITADFALDQGRDVYVAACRIGGPQSAGLDRLAAEGAWAVLSAAEILDGWGIPHFGIRAGTEYIEERDDGNPTTGQSLAAALRAELGLHRRANASVG